MNVDWQLSYKDKKGNIILQGYSTSTGVFEQYLQAELYKEIKYYSSVLQRFNSVSPELKREIIFTALENGCSDWLRELKESYRSFDPWNKRAFLIASSQLPKEERLFFLKNNVESGIVLEELISKWVKMR